MMMMWMRLEMDPILSKEEKAGAEDPAFTSWPSLMSCTVDGLAASAGDALLLRLSLITALCCCCCCCYGCEANAQAWPIDGNGPLIHDG